MPEEMHRAHAGTPGAVAPARTSHDLGGRPGPLREQRAQHNLAQALAAAGADFRATAERRSDGYSLTASTPCRLVARSGIDDAVLEQHPSPRLVELVEEIRQAMGQP